MKAVAKKSKIKSVPVEEITSIGQHDVLCGRGSGPSNHVYVEREFLAVWHLHLRHSFLTDTPTHLTILFGSGNIKYRMITEQYKARYNAALRMDKV